MLSAAPMALALAGADEPTDATALDGAVQLESQSATDGTGSPSVDQQRSDELADQFQLTSTDVVRQEIRHELVVIDTSSQDYQQLVDDLLANEDESRQFDVFLLDPDRDGIEQISEILAGFDYLDALHIVSHGTDGAVKLGNGWLGLDNVAGYAGQLVGWRDAFAVDADLLLYGCDLASNQDGRALVDSLSTLTSADVAASTDDTGHARLGGDWDLEYHAGSVESAIAFSESAQQSWVNLLGVVANQQAWTNLAANTDTSRTISATHTVTAGTDRLLLVTMVTRFSADQTINVTSATFGGVALNSIVTGSDPSTRTGVWMGYLLDSEIPTGAQTLSVTFSSPTNPTGKKLLAATYSGVDQTTPINDSSANTTKADAPIPFGSQIDYKAGGEVVYVASFGGTSNQNTTEPVGYSRIYSNELSGMLMTTISHKDDTSVDGNSPGNTAVDFAGTDQNHSLAVVALNPVLNSAPAITLPGAPVNYMENDAATVVDATATASDPDLTDFDTGTLTIDFLANGTANDRLAIRDVGTGSGQIGVSGLNVTYEGTNIGTFTGGTDGSTPLVITFNGSSTATAAQALMRNITYQNVSDSPSELTRTVRFVLTDGDGGTSNAATQAINVAAENDAPSGVTASLFSAIDEDDFNSAGKSVADFTTSTSDPDAGALKGIAVTDVNDTNGQWQYTLNGTNWFAIGSVSTASARLLPSDGVARVRFVPDPNYNSPSVFPFSYIAWDRTTGSAGGLADTSVSGGTTAFSTSGASVSIRVDAVNDAPSGSNNTVSTLEDTDHVFTAAEFGFSDPVEGDNLANLVISTAPTLGALYNDANGNGIVDGGEAVAATNVVSVADITAGRLKFKPAADANGTGYTSFTFQVQDDGGTANGGIDTDQTPNTMTIDVTPVNDQPSGVDNTVATLEDTDHVFTAAEFGFSDPVDGDSLANVIIATAPSSGALYNDANGNGIVDGGEALAATDVVTVADITAGRLKFKPAANANGLGYDTFTFQVQDDGGAPGVDTDQTPNTMTIDVTSVNDAPLNVTPGLQSTPPNTPVVFSSGNGNQIAIGDIDAGAGNDLQVTLTASNGTITLSGIAGLAFTIGDGTSDSTMVFTGTLSNINAALEGLTFTPTTSFNGTATLRIETDDQGNTGGGSLTDIDTVAINVGATQSIWLSTDDDSTAPLHGLSAWEEGDVISFSDPNLAFEPGTTDGTFSRIADFSALGDGSVNINGLHYVSRDMTLGGTSFSAVNVQAGDILFITKDTENFTGSDLVSRTINKRDVGLFRPDTPGEYSSGTFSILLDDPAGVDLSAISLVEQDTLVGDVVLNAGSFLFGQQGGTTEDIYHFSADDVGEGQTAGSVSLLIDGSNVTSRLTNRITGLELIEEDVTLGTGPGAFSLQAGQILVTMSNNGNAGSNNLSVKENDVFVLTVTETEMGPGGEPSTASAALLLEGVDVELSGGAEGLEAIALVQANLPPAITLPTAIAGYIENATPAIIDAAATISDSDSVGLDGGVLSVSFTAGGTVNDTLSVVAGGNVTIVGSDVRVTGTTVGTFSGGTAGSSLVINWNGNSSPAAAEEVLRQIAFSNNSENPSTTPRNVQFVLSDGDGGTSDPVTATVNVTRVNDQPSGTNNTVVTLEDTDHVFTAAEFGFSDPIEGDSLANVVIATAPTGGTLYNDADGNGLVDGGEALSATDVVGVADITAGRLKFKPAANANGLGYDSFTFQVQDDGGTASGGIDTDQTPNTMTIDVAAVNDEPSGADNTLVTLEDTDHVFTAAEFGFSDPIEGDSLANVVIATAPSNGTLYNDANGNGIVDGGEALAATDVVSLAHITAGRLKFKPAANSNGLAYDSFTFQVQDDGGTAGGGIDTDQTPNTMTIDVTPVNDPPSGADNTVVTLEDIDHVFTAAEFGFSDAIDGDSLANVIITTAPTDGTLYNDANGNGIVDGGEALAATDVVSLADITAGRLKFKPAANANGIAHDSFTFQVQDDGGAPGVDTDATPNTMTIDVTPVNDQPSGADNTVVTLEDTDHVFTTSEFGFSDPVEGDSLANVVIATAPSNGTLYNDANNNGIVDGGEALAATDVVSVADITAGRLKFKPAANASGVGYDSFAFHVQDDGGTANGGVDTDQTPNTMTIDVTPVNDDPTATDDGGAAFTTDEDTSFTTGNVLTNDTDPDTSDVLSVQSINITGTLGTVIDNGDGTFNYDPAGLFEYLAVGASATDTFSYTVSDGNGGTDTATVTITITGVNDGPTANDDGGAAFTTNEDSSFTTGNVLTNDTDPDTSDVLSVQSINTASTMGTVIDNGNGTFNYDPAGMFQYLAAGESATDTFTYTVDDGNGGTDTATVTVTITGANDGPTANDDGGAAFTTNEDSSFITGDVLTDDTDPDTSDVLSVQSINTTGTLGVVTDNGDGTFDYDPAGLFEYLAVGESVSDTFSYTVSDGNGGTDTATVTITIAGVNDGPMANDDDGAAFTTDEDSSFTTGNVLPNDTDPDTSDVLSVQSINTTGTLGTVTDNGDGTFDYDPAGLFEYLAVSESATDSFTYTVSDGNGGTDTATATITITGVNDGPIANDDGGAAAFTTNENNSFITANVLANDTDPDASDVLTVQSINTAGTLGTVTDNGDGTFDYDPAGLFEYLAAGESATDMFTYTVSDGNGGTDTATVTITITGVNDGPTANDDGGAAFTTDENNSFTTGNVLTNDTDPDTSDVLFVQNINTAATLGSVIDNGDGTFNYDPAGMFEYLAVGESASDTFAYTVSDSNGGTDTATVTITITGVNDAPTANNDGGAAFTSNEDTSFTTGNVLTNDTEPDSSDVLFVQSINTTGTLGTVIDNGDGTFDYDPAALFEYLAVGESATDTFSYIVSDGNGGTDTATVTVTITGANDGPTANDDGGASFTSNEDASFTTGNVLSNDTDPDTSDLLSVQSIDTASTLGTVIDNGDGTFNYDPTGMFEYLAVGENASDTFTYTVSDGNGGTDTATVTITITGVNDGPTANDDGGAAFTINEDTSFTTGNVLPNDTDPDTSDVLFVQSINTTGTLGTVIDNGDGTFDYDPAGMFEYLAVGENATDTFTYTVSDGNGGSDTATVTITVTGVNDTPVANANSYNVNSDETLVVAAPGVIANDVDIDGDPLTAVLVSGPSRGTLMLEPDGSFAYVPDLNFEGTVTFTYKVTDGSATSNTVVVTIEVKLAGGPSPPGVDPPPQRDEPDTEEDPPIDETLLPEPVIKSATEPADIAARIRSTLRTNSSLEFTAGRLLAPAQVDVADLYYFDAAADVILPVREAVETVERLARQVEGFVDSLVMWEKLNDFRNELQDNGYLLTFTAGSVAVLSMAATAGYVLWSIKGGYLLASMMSQLPAWRFIDPLPVIDASAADDHDENDTRRESHEDEVEQLVS